MNQIRDEPFRQRVNQRIRSDFAGLTGNETLRQTEKLAETILENEGFVFVDAQGRPLRAR